MMRASASVDCGGATSRKVVGRVVEAEFVEIKCLKFAPAVIVGSSERANIAT